MWRYTRWKILFLALIGKLKDKVGTIRILDKNV
jgi:hypothetical protein